MPEKRSRLSLVADTTTGDVSDFALNERITIELGSYLMMSRLAPTGDPLKYYATHTHLPLLARCAHMLLSCPATAVPSERVFSGAGGTYEGRPRLSAKTAEMLVVSKYALKRGLRCDIQSHSDNVNDALFNVCDDSDDE